MKRKLFTLMLSMLIGLGIALADNFQVNFTTVPENCPLTITTYIDFHTGNDYGECYPNYTLTNNTDKDISYVLSESIVGTGDNEKFKSNSIGSKNETIGANKSVSSYFENSEPIVKGKCGTYEIRVTLNVTENDVTTDYVFVGDFGYYIYSKISKIEAGTFTCTGTTSGKLAYELTLSDTSEEAMNCIDHIQVWASRAGHEEMDVTNVGKNLTGELTLTELPENATTHIWPKAKIVYIDGTSSSNYQTELDVTTWDVNAPATMKLNAKVASGEGSEAKLSYDIELENAKDNPVYTVKLYKGESTEDSEPVETLSDTNGTFTISPATPGESYTYTIKAIVKGDEGMDLEETQTLSWTQTGNLPHIEYTLNPTTKGCDFKYTVTLGGYNPDDVETVKVYLCKPAVSEPDTEANGFYQAGFDGDNVEMTYHALFDEEQVTVYFKSYLILKDGTRIQLNSAEKETFDTAFDLKRQAYPEIESVVIGELKDITATSVTVPFEITFSNGNFNYIDHFYIVGNNNVGGEIGGLVNFFSVNNTTYTGEYTLNNLPANAATELKLKFVTIYTGDGVNNGAPGQAEFITEFFTVTTGENGGGGETPEVKAPETVPVPNLEAEKVKSLLSAAYTPVTTFNIGGWGQHTADEKVSIAGAYVWHVSNFNYLGWELASHIDVSDCDYMHVDYYPMNGTTIGFTPISPNAEKPYTATVTPGEWNSFDVPFTHWDNVNFADLYQVKFDQGDGNENEGYIANVYFYKSENGGGEDPGEGPEEPGDAIVSGTIHQGSDDKDYTYKVKDYEIVYNDDNTITFNMTMTWEDSYPVTMNPQILVKIQNGGDGFAGLSRDGDKYSATAPGNYEDGTVINISLYAAYNGGLLQKLIVENYTLVHPAVEAPGAPESVSINNFEWYSAGSGTIAYSIQFGADADFGTIDHINLWASSKDDDTVRFGEEAINVGELDGELELTGLPEYKETDIVLHAQVVDKDGNASDVVISGEYTVNTNQGALYEGSFEENGYNVEWQVMYINNPEIAHHQKVYVKAKYTFPNGKPADLAAPRCTIVGLVEDVELVTEGTFDLSEAAAERGTAQNNSLSAIAYAPAAHDGEVEADAEPYTETFEHLTSGTLNNQDNLTVHLSRAESTQTLVNEAKINTGGMTTEVEEIEVAEVIADAETVYFTLQGIQVKNPVKGQIYIAVTPAGNKKIVF